MSNTPIKMWKRIQYRACYRGTLEMDCIFRQFFNTYTPETLSKDDALAFEQLVEESDSHISMWLRDPHNTPDLYKNILKYMRVP